MCEEFSGASATGAEATSRTGSERRLLPGGRALTLGVLLGSAGLCLSVGVLTGSASVPGSAAAVAAAATPTPTSGSTLSPAPTSGPAATSAPAATDSISFLCGEAAGLTAGNKPEEALALIEKVRGQGRSPSLTATTACEEQRLAAVAKTRQQSPATTPPTNIVQDLNVGWDGFVKNVLNPATGAGLGLLGLVAAFLFLGRLLVYLPKIPWVKIKPGYRAALVLGGLAVIVVGSCAIVKSLADDKGVFAVGTQIQVALAGLLALAGSLALALYFSSRLRIALDVRDPEGDTRKVDVSRVGALLLELGSEPPRGMEVPEGSDTTDLGNGVLTVMFTNKVLAALQKILAYVFNVTPWRAVVASGNDNSVTVAMSRNGLGVGAANIDRATLGLPAGKAAGTPAGQDAQAKSGTDATLDLHKMAAAFILVTLAGKHHGFEGLCGTTSWRSLGWHCIGSDHGVEDEQARKMLGAAVEDDPGSLLVEVAFQNRMYRKSTEQAEIRQYADWLLQRADDIKGKIVPGETALTGLLYRVELTFIRIVFNLPRKGNDFLQLGPTAQKIALDLLQELAPRKRMPLPVPLAHSIRLDAALVYYDLHALGVPGTPVESYRDLYEEAHASIAPRTAYSAACSLARREGMAGPKEVQERLRYAFVDQEWKDWARKDPEFEELRKDKGFLEFLGVKPRGDFWKLEAFEPYEKRLREAGIARPGDLYQKEVGQSGISAYLKVSPLVLKRLCRLAALVRRAQAVPDEGEAGKVSPFRVEVVGALVQAGIESPEEIDDEWLKAAVPGAGALDADAGDFVERLRKSIEQRVLIAPDTAHLKAWLLRLKGTHET
ncbi:hypothetical protein [Arthrobacter sp. QXT-31]|uniref:hypothetical protein n=1 Tax=Arthrobacter sp. QXT-31 TaxID=1357915 RepID=UPI00156027EE|nr:hypothetical protein [Arthrobacter sp. QXT-31]